MNQLVETSSNVSALSQINTNITVGIDDVVNVFISRYETGLNKQRTSNQAIIKDLNVKIKAVTDSILDQAKQYVEIMNIEGEVNNGIFTLFTSIGKDSYQLKIEQKHVQYKINTKIKSNTSNDHYNKETSGSIYGEFQISESDLEQYNDLMSQKAQITAILTQINNDLRNVGSKERQVRGQIAEQKLVSQGMQDLINDPTILALIDTSTIQVIE
ncbi:MAG: hypothetical protein EO766_17295 [Hydrotalea sp. AMD]|uniref:hypothetical protein n=1 Tax=Hydrotalea sp. AMD TaxID=2501297 RepID=UPI0010258596|nr:hypothetical protein [Hydrotalea sp. AMD]RWZ84354.1 MAG: hypothetical protein EO766_17295 [Hydrotalea sp. AMD]